MHVKIHSGLIYVNFEEIFVAVSYKKEQKARFKFFYTINVATLKTLLPGKLVDNHLRLVQAKFGVTAAISTGKSSPLEPKKLIFLAFRAYIRTLKKVA